MSDRRAAQLVTARDILGVLHSRPVWVGSGVLTCLRCARCAQFFALAVSFTYVILLFIPVVARWFGHAIRPLR